MLWELGAVSAWCCGSLVLWELGLWQLDAVAALWELDAVGD